MKVCITGANRGIGLAFAHKYKTEGFDVVALCRQSSPELDDLGVEVHSGIDVTDASALASLASKVGENQFDILINNAGIMRDEVFPFTQYSTMIEQFEVNTLAPLKVATALFPCLKKPAKLAMITSRMGSIADNTSGGRYGYRMSKAALNAASVSLAQDLKDQQIAVAILHPGFVQTDMTKKNGNLTPKEATANLFERIEELTLENSGTFWHCQGEELPW